MSEQAPPETPGPEVTAEPAATPEARPRRSGWRLLGRLARRTLMFAAILLAVAFVTTLSVDLGPGVRGLAERAGANYLKRDFTIGRLSIRLLTGRFLVEDLRIGGLEKDHKPFLVARTIEVSMDFSALAHREVLVESVRMTGWRMAVETWPNGRHSFPRFTRERTQPPGPKRFVTTVRSVVASDGEFDFEDHGVPWRTVARNLEVTVEKTTGYGGTAKFRNGTVDIQQYLPMKTDMDGVFTIEGPLVRFSQLQLRSDGSRSDATGTVDMSRWPEQTWHVKSIVDFPRMREIFFAREKWVLGGEGHFTGIFHLFKGGRELKGDFTSAEAQVNGMRFPKLAGSLIWVPDRFEVTEADADFYGGSTHFSYGLEPLGKPGVRPTASFDADFDRVDLSTLGAAFDWPGIRPAGAMSGYSKLHWPNGRFADKRGEGILTFAPPDGVSVASRQLPPDANDRDAARVRPWGPFNPDPRLLGDVPVAGELSWRLDPEWIDLSPSWMATPDTYVSFEGRTAYGERSTIPFHVTSTDWQESDRVLAGIMTAFGSPTTAVAVGGYGQFDGTMHLAFRRPRIDGHFSGQRLRAWDVVWGAAEGDLVIENGYVTLTNARVTSGESVVETEGRFALGYPRRDGGEEIDARVRLANRPLADLRHAFLLDDYPIEGKVSGEFHLYGKYQTPFGFGRMQIDEGVAYDEPFETATASLRFEGQGVRLDGIEARKADGQMTGAAYVGWEGTYSFNFSGRRVPVESVHAMTFPQAPLTGQLDFTAAGSGLFESPQYNVRMSVSDLFVKDEGIGEVTARLTIRDNTLGVELDAASPRLIVTGTGRISMTDEYDAELTFRFTDTSLDPYVRTFRPELSPFTTAVASGTLRVTGELSQPPASSRRRACRQSHAASVRLRGAQRRAAARRVRAGSGSPGPVPSGRRRHAARRGRNRQPRRRTDRDSVHRRCEPRDPARVPPRSAQLGTGRPGGRHQRPAGQPGVLRPRLDCRRTHPPLLPAARARSRERPSHLRRPRREPGRSDGAAGRWAGSFRWPHQPGRLSAIRVQPHGDRGGHAPAVPGGLPVRHRRRPVAARRVRGAGARRHGHREELGVVAARRGVGQLPRVCRTCDAGRPRRGSKLLPAAVRRASHRALDPAHRQQPGAHRLERRPVAAWHLRQAAGLRPRRNRARRGDLRRQALRRHARHHRLQQSRTRSSRSSMSKPRRACGSRGRTTPSRSMPSGPSRGFNGGSTPIRRCRRWTCWRCCSTTPRPPTRSWPRCVGPTRPSSS